MNRTPAAATPTQQSAPDVTGTPDLDELITHSLHAATGREKAHWYTCLTSLGNAVSTAQVTCPSASYAELRRDVEAQQYGVWAGDRFHGWIEQDRELPAVLAYCAAHGALTVTPCTSPLGRLLRLPVTRWRVSLAHRLARGAL